jgi:hypothetical protein
MRCFIFRLTWHRRSTTHLAGLARRHSHVQYITAARQIKKLKERAVDEQQAEKENGDPDDGAEKGDGED